MAKKFFLLWLGIFCIVLIRNSSNIFGPQVHEICDPAADSIQVDRAKSLMEIYGNYSRWGFHHPGPGILYVHAFGEVVFYDTLKIVSSPMAAHCLAAALFHSFFFAWGLLFFAAFVKVEGALAVGLLIASVHFSLLPRGIYFDFPKDIFSSKYPPAPLIPLFFCLVTSILGIWDGNRKAIYLALISGFFMLHAHLAQPLFVLPLWGMAVLAFRHARRAERVAKLSFTDWISLSIITGLFLLPWIIDITHGKDGNIYAILSFLRSNKTKLQHPVTVLLHLLSYFSFLPDQLPPIFSLGFKRPLFTLAPRLPLILFGLGMAVYTIRAFSQPAGPYRSWSPQQTLFFKKLCGVIATITLLWEFKQDGVMFVYNSIYLFSLTFLLCWSAALIWIAKQQWNRTVQFTQRLTTTAIVLFLCFPLLTPTIHNDEGLKILASVERKLRADGFQNKPLIIATNSNWCWATSTALALQRKKVPYAVAGMAFMFTGSEPVIESLESKLRLGAYSPWFIANKTNEECRYPMGNDQCLYSDFPTIEPGKSRLEFSSFKAIAYPFIPPIRGNGHDGLLSWTPSVNGTTVALPFRAQASRDPIYIQLSQTEGDALQSINLNGKPLKILSKGRVEIPPERWNESPLNLLIFEFPPLQNRPLPFQAQLSLEFLKQTP